MTGAGNQTLTSPEETELASYLWSVHAAVVNLKQPCILLATSSTCKLYVTKGSQPQLTTFQYVYANYRAFVSQLVTVVQAVIDSLHA